MKPWLLNILACPMDKHHPLEVYFFKYTSSSDEPSSQEEEIRILAKQIVDDVISPDSITDIHDLSGDSESSKKYSAMITALPLLMNDKSRGPNYLLKEHPDRLGALYQYLNLLEAEEGLLYCPKCGRWYPIGCSLESVPEMLPDELREKGKELEWLAKWGDKLPEKILKEGKPFNLST